MVVPLSSSSSSVMAVLLVTFIVSISLLRSCAQLSTNFYDTTCPTVTANVTTVITQAMQNDSRITASLLRLHFHDCFVQGCDASILLDSNASIASEKSAGPNNNSARGFDVVDNIKAAVETICPNIVSCADILAIAAQVSIRLSGGPSYNLPLGRRDSITASQSLANTDIPAPTNELSTIISKFKAKGLNITDLVSLSGGHTIGLSQCKQFSDRLYNFNSTGMADTTLNASYLVTLQSQCPQSGSGSSLVNLDKTSLPTFDNAYFTNLQTNEGVLQSDQELLSTANTATNALVNNFAGNQTLFFENFVASIIKMGNIGTLTGSNGEIRKKCTAVN